MSVLTIADISAAAAPIGIFLVRTANFIKPELWGRPTDVPWAMFFRTWMISRVIQASSMKPVWKDCCCSSWWHCAFVAVRSDAPAS